MGKAFEAANPGVTVKFSFAGSQVLVTQIEQGAPADVFASADHKNMDALVTANLVASGYKDFATNLLQVILPPGNPANVQTLQDLAKPGLKLVLEDPSVPAGNYTREILTNMSKDPTYGTDFSTKVLANVVSNETDVKQVVAKVDQGEGDAGIVYVTDALAAPDLKTISIPANYNVIAQYPIAALEKASNPDLASAFVAYVLSADGQPRPATRPATGFEDQEARRDITTPTRKTLASIIEADEISKSQYTDIFNVKVESKLVEEHAQKMERTRRSLQ